MDHRRTEEGQIAVSFSKHAKQNAFKENVFSTTFGRVRQSKDVRHETVADTKT